MKKKILVIGSLNMDIVLGIERMPAVGETVLGSSLSYIPGGKGANQAFAVGRLGGDVTMLGCVGDDNFGAELVRSLSKAGVNVGRIYRSSEGHTGTAAIYVDANGDNSIVVIAGANTRCDEAYLRQHDDIFVQSDYILLQMEIPYSAVWYAVRRAAELGKTVILNPAPAPESVPPGILEKLDFLTPNETELAALSGCDPSSMQSLEEGARSLGAAGVQHVLVTVGSKGSLLCSGGQAQLFPATDMKAVDSTAAGDCFNAALATALAEGQRVEQAVAFANVAAGIAVTSKGAQSSIPTRAQVDAYLADSRG